jgi:hypothetical protein
MAPQAAAFDLSTAFLDQPKTLAYGIVRGAGNLILQQELSDKSKVCFYMLGEGRWDSLLRLWVNNNLVTLPSSSTVHFHPGDDGEIGNGLSAVSTGGDQHVDQFFTLLPGGLSPITFSRYAWLALKVAPDPAAPSADLTVLADYQAMQVRQFDSSGNQTAFAWTQNWAWIICDFLVRKFILREGKINQPLIAAELARFDWASFAAAATYYDAVLSGGQKRFSDGGVVFLTDGNTADQALEQMLMLCRSYILERNGKLSLYADQARASVFTFTSGNVQEKTFKAYKDPNLRTATNRLLPTYRDYSLASGSSDDATRFAITSNPTMDHEAHQRTVGARGAGLSLNPKITQLAVDLGVNTPERVWRILKGMLVRQLGDDVDANSVYNAPFSAEWIGYEDSLAVECGDLVTIDPSLSEEFGGKLFEVLQLEERPDGTRDLIGLEYMPNAFPDVAPAQQTLQAPVPGTGLAPLATGVDANGNQQIGTSTALNKQGNIPAIVMAAGPLAFSSRSPAGLSIVQMSWSAFTITRGDGSVVSVPANTSQPAPAAPTVSSVAGGALAARTLFFRVALVKDNMIMSVSGETSFSKAVNTLFKVTSPSSQPGYDGWIPLAGGTTGVCGCITGATVSGILVVPIAFGTDYTEPTSGINGVGQSVDQLPTPPSPAGSGTLTTPINLLLAVSTAYFFYPLWDITLAMVRFAGGLLSAISTSAAQKQSADGMIALNTGSVSFTTPASGGSGGGSGGGGGGGKGTP